MKSSIVEQTQSQFILVSKDHLYGLLGNSTTVQEVVDALDIALVPVSKFNDGLSTKEDKAIIDYLAVNASDKVYVYSNQEQGLISPITRIIVADNEGLTIQYPDPKTARVGMKPNFRSVTVGNGVTYSPTVENPDLSFINSDTADVLIENGKVKIDATKTKNYALAMSLVLGG